MANSSVITDSEEDSVNFAWYPANPPVLTSVFFTKKANSPATGGNQPLGGANGKATVTVLDVVAIHSPTVYIPLALSANTLSPLLG